MNSKIKVDFDTQKRKFHIKCPFHMNHHVRSLPTRRFSKKGAVWTAPVTRQNCKRMLDNNHYEFSRAAFQMAMQGAENPVIKKRAFPTGYQFKTEPYEHQKTALHHIYGVDAGALFMEMGTGKTKVSIDVAGGRFSEGAIDGALIACPVSIRGTWVREFKTHCPCEVSTFVVGRKSAKEARDFNAFLNADHPFKVLIVGIESMSQGEAKGWAYECADRFQMVRRTQMVVDEAHLIKNHDANRSKNIVKLGMMTKYKLALTGTPVLQGPMDLYMIFQYLDQNIIGVGDFYSFRNLYAEMGGYEGREIVGYINLDELMDNIKPYVYQCTKEEALDLPPKLYEVREIEMAPEQKRIYDKAHKDRMAEINFRGAPDVVLENVLMMYTALQQILSGYVTYLDEDSGTRKISWIMEPQKVPRLKEMMSTIEEAPADAQWIIWAKYRPEIESIVEALECRYGQGCAVEYHGGIKVGDERDENEALFQSGGARFFVANANTGGVGLTLNCANYAYYYSNSFKLVDRDQSEDRNHRIGQDDKVTYVDGIHPGTVDVDIQEALASKKDLADFVKNRLRPGIAQNT